MTKIMAEKEPLKEIDINYLLNDDPNVINEVIVDESQMNEENMKLSNENKELCAEILLINEDDDNDDHQNQFHSKRAKTRNSLEKLRAQSKKILPRAKKNESRCKICQQKLNDYKLKLYNGHPNDALDEFNVLIDQKLSLFTGDEENISQNDMRATNKITMFSVYCKNGHLCSFDSGLIENQKDIYLSGYVKPIYSDDPLNLEDGVPAKDLGPIVGWFVTGFDGSKNPTLALSTALGEYFLMQPAEDYAYLMHSVREKTFFSKIVIECLIEEPTTDYEDLLNKFETIPMPSELPRFSEDLLIYHAQFICDQIDSFDEGASPEDPLLIDAPCVQSLIDLAGVTFSKKGVKSIKKYQQSLDEEWRKGLTTYKQKRQFWTKATTTEVVHNLFEDFFPDELNKTTDKLLLKRRRCGTCEACLEIDCGECTNCKNMIKFGGPGTSKQACIKRKCPNMELVEDAGDDYEEYDTTLSDKEFSIELHRKIMSKLKEKTSSQVSWVGEPFECSKGKFYEAVMINSEKIEKNDYIFIEPIDSTIPMQVIKVKYMWENKLGIRVLHGSWLWRGKETILGDTSSPRELFLVDECQDVPIAYVESKANVIKYDLFNDFKEKESLADLLKENSMLLFYQKRYDHVSARFEDLLPDIEAPEETKHCFCSLCSRDAQLKKTRLPQLFEANDENGTRKETKYGMVKYLDEEFRVGSAVYLKPKTFVFGYSNNNKQSSTASKREIIDEEKYPEFYRKSNDRVKGSNFDTPEPYDIGYITNIFSESKSKLMASVNLCITVKKLYRPENTHKGESLRLKSDLNMVYWSDEECDVKFNFVMGKCYLAYSENLQESIQEWSTKGPNRFYFTEAYDSKNKEFIDPSAQACNVGKTAKKDVNLKSKSKKTGTNFVDPIVNYPQISRKLRTLDVFAGCGGLSEGLKNSGVSENLWAVENDEAAAHAYRLNNPKASVFTVDCNKFLEKVLNGETTLNGQKLPRKGEVDLLCGGPPCQGFSGMNRFNSRAYSSFKNSLIVSYLSFCDYYRPRFFIMENVRNFVSFKKSTVLKLTLSCLVRMGYQCTFGVLQAGTYGVPQTRRRLILIAVAPGEVLPRLPSPLNVFSKLTCQLTVDIDNVKYCNLNDSYESAPYRAVTVYDALSDLPEIKNGHENEEMQYESEPITHFQRKIRGTMNDESILYDHSCKDLGPLTEARMGLIPIKSGSDWRDLPNIEVRLSDGTYTSKLEYKYHDKKSGKSSSGALRGVCGCCEGKPCDPRDKQVNTLIPWCLPHTAHRHNQWAGLYGRIEWDGFFSTTITNPEPMGKQGRVLHPEQNRVVSVRECARSQGFPDSFRFYGNLQDKHRQIGNAVPPPLAEAIGREILKSVSLRNLREDSK